MYPVTGASGGATRSPLLRMPTMLVSRDPCHNSILQQPFNTTTTTSHKQVDKSKNSLICVDVPLRNYSLTHYDNSHFRK